VRICNIDAPGGVLRDYSSRDLERRVALSYRTRRRVRIAVLFATFSLCLCSPATGLPAAILSRQY